MNAGGPEGEDGPGDEDGPGGESSSEGEDGPGGESGPGEEESSPGGEGGPGGEDSSKGEGGPGGEVGGDVMYGGSSILGINVIQGIIYYVRFHRFAGIEANRQLLLLYIAYQCVCE